jgi:hypothetical protein
MEGVFRLAIQTIFIINGKAELPENRGYSLIRINSRATIF